MVVEKRTFYISWRLNLIGEAKTFKSTENKFFLNRLFKR